LTRAAVSHWERGVACPSLESLLALSDLFDVPLDSFFIEKSNCLFVKAISSSVSSRENDPPHSSHERENHEEVR
jgi:transcriptional regulator with XRE-family HTH domain